MTSRKPLPEELEDIPFTRSAAITARISLGRLRASDLHRPFHGVHQLNSHPASIERLCRAYQTRMADGHAFSHLTAAKLYGLPLPLYVEADSTLHVSAAAPRKAPTGARVTGHRLAASQWETRELIHLEPDTAQIFAFCLVSPAIAWAQLATVLAVGDLVALGDAIVGGEVPLASTEQLRAVARAWRGRRGATAITSAAGQVRVGSLSRPETLMRLILIRAGFPEPQLNMVVTDARGHSIAMADLSWPKYRVLIEYEGDIHRVSRGKFTRDITRGERYADGGWFQLRASSVDVFDDPNPFLARLARRLRERGWDPGRHEIPHIAGERP